LVETRVSILGFLDTSTCAAGLILGLLEMIFFTTECDKSCNGCFGDGPDMCETCASDFVMRDKLCIGEFSFFSLQNLPISYESAEMKASNHFSCFYTIHR
jgi:hypothetical protein